MSDAYGEWPSQEIDWGPNDKEAADYYANPENRAIAGKSPRRRAAQGLSAHVPVPVKEYFNASDYTDAHHARVSRDRRARELRKQGFTVVCKTSDFTDLARDVSYMLEATPTPGSLKDFNANR